MEVVWFARSGQAAEDQEALLGFSAPLELSESHPVPVFAPSDEFLWSKLRRAVPGRLFCTNQGMFLVFLTLQPEASVPIALLPLLLAAPKPMGFVPGQFE